MPSVFVMNGSRGKLAAALHLDAVIDDRSENCLDVVVDSKAPKLGADASYDLAGLNSVMAYCERVIYGRPIEAVRPVSKPSKSGQTKAVTAAYRTLPNGVIVKVK